MTWDKLSMSKFEVPKKALCFLLSAFSNEILALGAMVHNYPFSIIN